MENLTKKELVQISGGWIPVVILIAKGIAWAAGVAAAACAVAYGVGYASGKGECEEVCQ